MPANVGKKLTAPALSDSVSEKADWLELSAILLESRPITRSFVHNWLDFAESNEDLPGSGEIDERAEEVIIDLFEEICRRAKASGTSFPFLMGPGNDSFSLRPQPWTSGCYAYLSCLFSTQSTYPKFLEKSFFTDDERQRIPDFLQIVATIAAAGYVRGCASSFGWPRPAATALLDALNQLTSTHLKEGTVRLKPLPGSRARAKDGGIDVIAWRHFPDELPGKVVLLGQCASGKKWAGKGVRSYIKTFFSDYYEVQITSQLAEAIFIPFCLGVDSDDIAGETYSETLSGVFRHHSEGLGVIIDRCRLAYLLPAGIARFNEGHYVERSADFREVEEWVDICVDWLRSEFVAA